MANPLARGIMNNIVQKSGKVHSNNYANKAGNISSKEESLLKDIIGKERSASMNKSFNNSTKPSKGYGQKLKLEDLAKGGKTTENREIRENKKSNSMVTLGQLAEKSKKTSNQEEQRSGDNNQSSRKNEPYVKSNVIPNLEALIPKVSLNSIGKKGSLK